MRKITIADIAMQTGFSKTTISRYLNGKYDSMSAQTRQKIADAITRAGFKPNQMARNLRLQKSHLIGVLVSDIQSPFSSILYSGIADECERHGYTAILASTADSPEKERRYIDSMIAKSVEGLIVNATGENVDYLAQVNRTLTPIVLADRPLHAAECDIVSSNLKQGLNDMLDLAQSKGYTRIALVTLAIGTNQTRRIVRDAFVGYHARYGKSAVVLEFSHKASLHAQCLGFVEAHKGERMAFLAANGMVLQHIGAFMKQHNLRAPQDVGLCGVDNWPWMELAGLGMTVLEQPTFAMGQLSAQCLLEKIHGRDGRVERYLECKLIKRGSL
ncbi:LacI family DNA-binding transcriptional regulator [Pasteurellaceae bacterium HPA106]|uniref:LacI family DNA-binding transcriptional regulator n=1 Tax=Spirabiliibacterium pneumoniae TaxID=221400 RepID=UPI001AAD8BED|nr:LacI family DNA-binding transcriptional regulator [Spirabiliibacterium pneumoniae]MBE2895783.1 LacI family DNA-binding transcriptional regulator [Spirabiliibacterium pneumoniae]